MLAIAAGCSQDTGAALPSFLQRLTADIESGPVTESPGAIWRYRYRDQFVYYVPPLPCCDFASTLYDAGGAILCSPDGGLSGDGDGRCADFFATRSEEERVWRDARTPAR